MTLITRHCRASRPWRAGPARGDLGRPAQRPSQDLDRAARRGVEAGGGEPVAAELEPSDHALVLDDGPAPGGAGDRPDADEVAVVGDAGARLLVFEVADAGGGGGQVAGELVGRRWLVGEAEQVVDGDAEGLRRGREPGHGEAAAAVLDLGDQVAGVAESVGELQLGEPQRGAGLAQALRDDVHAASLAIIIYCVKKLSLPSRERSKNPRVLGAKQRCPPGGAVPGSAAFCSKAPGSDRVWELRSPPARRDMGARGRADGRPQARHSHADAGAARRRGRNRGTMKAGRSAPAVTGIHRGEVSIDIRCIG